MHDPKDDLRDTGSLLSYDGRAHLLSCTAGSWRIRMELEELGKGEVIGVGMVWTTTHDTDTEVIVSGRIDDQGITVVTLTPVMPCRLDPISLVLRVERQPEVHDPIVTEGLEVRGLAGC